jgi:hypothetical protein
MYNQLKLMTCIKNKVKVNFFFQESVLIYLGDKLLDENSTKSGPSLRLNWKLWENELKMQNTLSGLGFEDWYITWTKFSTISY